MQKLPSKTRYWGKDSR